MKKHEFLRLKVLFEEYQVCERSLNDLKKSYSYLKQREGEDLGLFKFELGSFRRTIGDSTGGSVQGIKPVMMELVERMIAFYEQRIVAIDRSIEEA